MEFGLSDEQEMIVSTVRSFVEKEIYPHEEMVERTGSVPRELGEEIKRKVKTPPRPPNAKCRNSDPRRIEPCVHHLESAIDLAQHLGIRQATIVEIENAVFVAPMADRLIPLPHLKPRMPPIHKEASNPLFRPLGRLVHARRHKDDEEISMLCT